MTLEEFFIEVCNKMGWSPTPWRLEVFKFWAKMEGVPFTTLWNPLATTRVSSNLKYNLKFDNGNGPGNWNSVPVKVYASAADGVEATVQTLKLDYYPNIRKCFEDQRGYAAAIGPRDFTSWVGSEAYGSKVVDFMNQTTAPKRVETDSDNVLNDVIVIQRDLLRLALGKHPTAWKLHRYLRETTYGADFEYIGDYRDYA